VHTAPARPGLIVVDASLGVISSNSEAVRILTFPDPPDKMQRLGASLAGKIRSMFVEKRPPFRMVNEFRSAKRTYFCRSFPLQILEHANGSNSKHGSSPSPGWLLVMLERASNESVTIAELSERFGLTLREQETVKYLLEGLTSKEIAQRMEISPNTVKAFIRLVMVKLNVSTRSGIIGKIVGWKAGVGLGNGNGLPHRPLH
jgi:DNA-binding CsgD family transcriptional regulator